MDNLKSKYMNEIIVYTTYILSFAGNEDNIRKYFFASFNKYSNSQKIEKKHTA